MIVIAIVAACLLWAGIVCAKEAWQYWRAKGKGLRFCLYAGAVEFPVGFALLAGIAIGAYEWLTKRLNPVIESISTVLGQTVP